MWTFKPNFHKAHDEKAQAQKAKNEVQDLIQDLGGPMTRGRQKKTQEALQYKVNHLLKAQLLKHNHMEETKLITYLGELREGLIRILIFIYLFSNEENST